MGMARKSDVDASYYNKRTQAMGKHTYRAAAAVVRVLDAQQRRPWAVRVVGSIPAQRGEGACVFVNSRALQTVQNLIQCTTCRPVDSRTTPQPNPDQLSSTPPGELN